MNTSNLDSEVVREALPSLARGIGAGGSRIVVCRQGRGNETPGPALLSSENLSDQPGYSPIGYRRFHRVTPPVTLVPKGFESPAPDKFTELCREKTRPTTGGSSPWWRRYTKSSKIEAGLPSPQNQT